MNTRPAAVRFAALVLAASLALSGCQKDVINDETYAQLKPGMAQSEVERIMGGPGEKQQAGGVGISSGGIATGANSNSQVTYVWKAGSKEISVTFDAKGNVVSTGRAGF